MTLRFTPLALRQIDDALDYVSSQSPRRALLISKRIEEVAALLQLHPAAARRTSRSNTRRYVLTPYPYVLFYRLARGEVVILRFRHTARRPLS